MEYRVKHKLTGEEKTLTASEVNDMMHGDSGEIVVFDTEMEAYILLDDIC